MKVIEELQQSRSKIVHFFDEIVSTIPEGVFLTSIKQQGASVIIDGVAESNGRVSNYLKNFDASEWFTAPQLIVIETDQAKGRPQRLSTFKIRVTLLKTAKSDAALIEVE